MKIRKYPFYLPLGIVLVLAMQLCLFAGISSATAWATPVLWTGLILVLDALLFAARGDSLIRSGKIIPVALISIVSWWVFEWYNIFLNNWHYVNLPSPLWLRYLSYAWSFATIAPAVLLMYGVLHLFMKDYRGRPVAINRRLLAFAPVLGLFFLALPIIPFSMYYANRAAQPDLFSLISWSANTWLSEFMSPFVWTGFVLLLEPFNYLMGNPCLLRSIEKGRWKTPVVLSLAGLLCGYLWEFWNYWALAKWYYSLPFDFGIRLFEMPIAGYLGFIPFSWELYNIVSLLCPGAIAIIEENRP
jgi:hypothetical protein